jgi:hypothetical protein
VRDDELDHILSRHVDIVPSSGFAASVMETVRSETAGPPPIAFPWKCAFPGLAAAAILLVSVVVVLVRGVNDAPSLPSQSMVSTTVPQLINAAKTLGVGWILLSLLLTLVSVTIPTSLIRATPPQ